MVSGTIEFDYWSEKDECWEPHCHLVIMSENKRKLSRIFGKYFRSPKKPTKTRVRIRQPKRIGEVDLPHLPRALAYTVKFSPKLRKPRKRGEVRPRKRPPLEGRELYTAIKWLGVLDPEDQIRRKLQLGDFAIGLSARIFTSLALQLEFQPILANQLFRLGG